MEQPSSIAKSPWKTRFYSTTANFSGRACSGNLRRSLSSVISEKSMESGGMMLDKRCAFSNPCTVLTGPRASRCRPYCEVRAFGHPVARPCGAFLPNRNRALNINPRSHTSSMPSMLFVYCRKSHGCRRDAPNAVSRRRQAFDQLPQPP